MSLPPNIAMAALTILNETKQSKKRSNQLIKYRIKIEEKNSNKQTKKKEKEKHTFWANKYLGDIEKTERTLWTQPTVWQQQ